MRRRLHEVRDWKKLVRFCVGRVQLYAEPVSVEVRYFFCGHERRDADNYSPKFVMDGFVGSVIEDDDFDHVTRLIILRGGVDRQHPRMEVSFHPDGSTG